MASRLLLGLMGGFWLIMTALVWRSEYLDSNLDSTPVDADAVWRRVLTSPDSSSLAILHEDQRLGFCHLITSVAESLDQEDPTNAPAGMVRNIRRYRLDLSGSVEDQSETRNIRFDGELTLSQDQQWEAFQLQVIARPILVSIDSNRREGIVRLRIDSPDFSTERLIRLADLSQPESLLGELFRSGAWMGLSTFALAVPDEGLPSAQRQLKWSACTDRVMLGNSSSQIYRLQLNPLEGVEVVVLVSRAGEILRVDLPRNIRLVNEALTGL